MGAIAMVSRGMGGPRTRRNGLRVKPALSWPGSERPSPAYPRAKHLADFRPSDRTRCSATAPSPSGFYSGSSGIHCSSSWPELPGAALRDRCEALSQARDGHFCLRICPRESLLARLRWCFRSCDNNGSDRLERLIVHFRWSGADFWSGRPDSNPRPPPWQFHGACLMRLRQSHKRP
jgi:hypothetical protein